MMMEYIFSVNLTYISLGNRLIPITGSYDE